MKMFDWRHYLDFAWTLVSSPSEGSEASHRAAASRGYDAAFHKAREVLERTVAEWGQNLERVWKHRQHADYNSERDFELRHAEMAIEFASDVMSAVQSQRW